jgi:hypothetical protein
MHEAEPAAPLPLLLTQVVTRSTQRVECVLRAVCAADTPMAAPAA